MMSLDHLTLLFRCLGHLPHESISQMGPSTPMKEPGADINTAKFPAIQYVGRTNTFLKDDPAVTSEAGRRSDMTDDLSFHQ